MSQPSFGGFPPGKTRTFSLPAALITELLPQIDDVFELKVTLFAFYAIQQREGRYRYLRLADFRESAELMASLRQDPALLENALRKAVDRGTLLRADVTLSEAAEALYFINAEPGREAVDQIGRGEWQPGEGDVPVEILPERPNIYRLYEENIGPLTPIIAETLRDAEKDYPTQWIADAIRVAVERNAPHWNFIRAVLERWKKEGKRGEIAEGPDEGAGNNGERYVSGKYADFIEH